MIHGPIILLSFLLSLGTGAVSLYAAPIGLISEITGQPGDILRGNDSINGLVRTEINSMDVISTNAGTARIVFNDNTRVSVTEQSRLTIDSYVYDPQQGDNSRLGLRVGLGTVRYASGQIARINQQRVDISTPTATVAVRGTDFFMSVDEAGKSLVILVPSCDQGGNCHTGAIDVITPSGRVTLDQAFTATAVFSATSPPSPPVAVSITERGINNTLLISLPGEIRSAMNRTLRTDSRDQESDRESSLMGAQRPTGLQTDQLRSRHAVTPGIIVIENNPVITATRITDGQAVAFVRFGNGSSGTVTMTQNGDQATAQVGSGQSNTVIIRQTH